MKLIVSDLDGTFLDSNHEVIEENVAALKAAQSKGMEIAIATGRNYGNVLALCQRAGLKPHVISNNGAFVYNKNGNQIKAIGLDKDHVREALDWLSYRKYFYTLCTDHFVYMPANAHTILTRDYENAINHVRKMTPEKLKEGIDVFLTLDSAVFVNNFNEVLEQDFVFGNISAITLDDDKLRHGREYFSNYTGMSMTIAGKDIFEMIHPSASKGNALETLIAHLDISLDHVMAFGDNYNDISMLQRVGFSVAVENAEDDVKKICKYVSLSNDDKGVAYMIHKLLG
ncbi:Cof-type HAD-IIB family hydrolase [Pelosinus fermentans]|uniref:Cof-like hydrolase n=1 Tax=Pelosinus fermentans JBW45 TaxID=1192197 RepID=I9DGQ5_9FIRM|nr:Cof-type HAD-IIB family hydrolase [Pelosinus fermentans]AJQ26546.1 Cof-like hydrolase [Pelosinus fermentans JBW45]